MVVIVGTHARQGLSKLVLGSIAQEVLRSAHCPVLVALPKNYAGVPKSAHVEPPLSEKEQRLRAQNAPGRQLETHVYRSTDVFDIARRGSERPTGMRIV